MSSAIRTLRSFHAVKEICWPPCLAVDFKDASKYRPNPCGIVEAKQSCSGWNTRKWYHNILPRTCLLDVERYGHYSTSASYRSSQRSRSSTNLFRHSHSPFPVYACLMHVHREYSSHSRKSDDLLGSSSASRDSSIQTTSAAGNDWNDAFSGIYQSVVDAATYAGKTSKEVYDEMAPYISQLFESHSYFKDIVVPICWTLSATILGWLVLPRILRRLHYYARETPIARLSGKSPQGLIPYEESVWSSLEDPAKYLITFVAFSQLGVMIAPTTSPYLPQAWRGAVVLSVVWFLNRWKSNVFSVALANRVAVGLDRDKLLSLDKLSSVGLIILGIMALAEACGVAVQSILTVGGIGGVATAFAARDILGNLLSGLSLQFSQPFSIGDNIKAGSIEGQVVEMGLTTTSLINHEKLPVMVPNSLFSSQVIINQTRAQFRALVKTIPFYIDDLEKIPNVSESIKSVLKCHPAVVLEREAPYCFLSQIEDSYAELTIGCNLKNMRKEEWYSTVQDILLQATQILKQHGVQLGGTSSSFATINDKTLGAQ